MKITDQELIDRFGQDAAEVFGRTVNTLSDKEQHECLNAVFAGGQPEIRVRLVMGQGARISVCVVDKDGELHLIKAAGPSA